MSSSNLPELGTAHNAAERTERLRASALRYASLGMPVFPLHSIHKGRCSCGKSTCIESQWGKHPRTKNGLLDATTNRKTIEAWWKKSLDANIGLRTGSLSGICVLDVDPRSGGHDLLRSLTATHGQLAKTAAVQSGGGGQHFYFLGSENQKSWSFHGLELKADGSYIVAPPSMHKSGHYYEWTVPLISRATLAPLPAWLERRPRQQESKGKPIQRPPLPEVIPMGQRHTNLVRLAGAMRRIGANTEEIEAALQAVNRRCVPPKTADEVRRIAVDITERYEPGDSDVDEPFPYKNIVRTGAWAKLKPPAQKLLPVLAAFATRTLDGRLEVCRSIRGMMAECNIGKPESVISALADLESIGYLERPPRVERYPPSLQQYGPLPVSKFYLTPRSEKFVAWLSECEEEAQERRKRGRQYRDFQRDWGA